MFDMNSPLKNLGFMPTYNELSNFVLNSKETEKEAFQLINRTIKSLSNDQL
jgi:hypothetical protein